MEDLTGARVLVTGGTGSLGHAIVRRLMAGDWGLPQYVTIFSRDEAKQHYMRLWYAKRLKATDDIVYEQHEERPPLRFIIGDVRDYRALSRAVPGHDVIIHAAAMKQVPICEYFPAEAVATNVDGTKNLVRAVHEHGHDVKVVVGISTDKACKPVNVLGMTKGIMERILTEANLLPSSTRYISVRYGNVVASRGSVVPLLQSQIMRGGPVTITTPDMTRFLLSLDQAVDVVFEALHHAGPGECYIPRVPSAKIVDVAKALIGDQDIPMIFTGIRPGEKIHEILVSEEERYRTIERGNYYVIRPMLPELTQDDLGSCGLPRAYSSEHTSLNVEELTRLLKEFVAREKELDDMLA
ncbi:polysaccharide biosynthesis protein [Sulfobacillus thermosulfidooxidans]|uniref:polysaccharide biosynthesis protein n=1 Tax=Sulfobacillus thermosulfidooxidans TaxID=28034 RepID=UPI0004108E81|nr:polysaccharide biosynthesis protein [Sulfobacillus thermosulfidooxidans]